MTLEEVLPDVSIEYQGRTIGFCCDRCVSKFQANPQKYLANLPELPESPPPAGATQPAPVADDLPEDHPQESAQERFDPAAGARVEEGAPIEVEQGERVPWLGRVHPAIIHFPLAAMPLALLGFVVWVITGREAFAKADVLPLLVGAAASVLAVITGNIAHDAMRFSKNLQLIVERHQFVSTTVMILALCLVVVRIWRWNHLTGTWRWLYGIGLAIACGLLGLTGFFGGSLVFGPDHMKW